MSKNGKPVGELKLPIPRLCVLCCTWIFAVEDLISGSHFSRCNVDGL